MAGPGTSNDATPAVGERTPVSGGMKQDSSPGVLVGAGTLSGTFTRSSGMLGTALWKSYPNPWSPSEARVACAARGADEKAAMIKMTMLAHNGRAGATRTYESPWRCVPRITCAWYL